MRRFPAVTALLLGLAAAPFAVQAQEEPDSMDPVFDGLPDVAAEEGKTHSSFGLDTAERARTEGRAFGQSQAEAARMAGEGLGRDTAARARGDTPAE